MMNIQAKEMSKILLIDDDEVILSLLSKSLKQTGYAITACQNGVDAQKECDKTRFDMMVVDFEMSPLNGLETVSAIQIKHNYPFVFLTQHTHLDEGVIKKACELGALGYITKPFQYETLLSQIKISIVRAKHIESLNTQSSRNKSINQAVGILAERLNVSTQEAYNIIRNSARKKRVKSFVIAVDIIDNLERRICENHDWFDSSTVNDNHN